MPKRFLALLPLTIIVTACSSGVVDTWNPQAEFTQQNAQKQADEANCQQMQKSVTHTTSENRKINAGEWGYYLDGKKLIALSNCELLGEIGKTQEWEGSDPGIYYLNQYVLENGDIVEYSRRKDGSTDTMIVKRFYQLKK